MQQPYWASIHDDLADGIQFVANHGGVIESTEGSPQRPAKKRRRFSRVLDTQIRISVPHPPTSPARPSDPSPPPPAAVVDDSPSPLPPTPPAAVTDDSPSPLPPTPPAAVVDDSPSPLPIPPTTAVDDSLSPLPPTPPTAAVDDSRSPLPPTPAAPGSHPPSPQAIHPIQVILITST